MELRVIFFILQTLSYITLVSSVPKDASHQCLAVASDPDSVNIVFRIAKNDDPILYVYAFDATTLDTSTTANRVTDMACIKDSTVDPIVYDLTVTKTDASHSCGVNVYDDNGVSVAVLLVRVYAYDDAMLDIDDDSFVVRCSFDDLDPTIISTPRVEARDDQLVNILAPQFGAYLRILDPDNLKPVLVAELGQLVTLSAEFYPELSLGPDNYGTHFFVGFLSNDPLIEPSSSELYIIIHPRYGYRTDITVTTIDSSETYVKEDGTAVVVQFDPEFMGCATDGTPEQAEIGIEIYSHPMEVGVVVCNFEVGTADCYTAIPTDVTGTEYYATSMKTADVSAEFMIVAQADLTQVIIDVPAGSLHPDAGGQVTINLNKFDAYHFAVSTSDPDTSHVNGYHFTSNEPISLISGNMRYSSDHLSTQLPPVSTFGKHYVLVSVDLAGEGISTTYIIQAVKPDVTTTVTQYLTDTTTTEHTITTTTYPPLIIDIASGSHNEIFADQPIIVSQLATLSPTDGSEATLLIVPSVQQWSPSYTIDFHPADFFVTTVTVLKADSDKSQYTLNGDPIGLQTTSVAGPSGFMFAQGFTLPCNTVYEIKLADDITTMMVLTYATRGSVIPNSDVLIGFPAFGLRYWTECVKVTVGRRGDGIDNDCDGLIDEEKVDKINNDGDDETDEDTIALTKELVGAVGVRIINCRVSGDPLFSYSREITDADGCATSGAGPFIPASEFTPTPANTGIEPKYLRLGAIKLGMFIGAQQLHFKCDIDKYCTDDADTDCTTICQPQLPLLQRKKRQTEDRDNITTNVYVFPYSRNSDSQYRNVSLTTTSLIDCMDNTYIQVMIGFLAAVALTALFTAICFSCYIRRKRSRDKEPKKTRNFDWFPNKKY